MPFLPGFFSFPLGNCQGRGERPECVGAPGRLQGQRDAVTGPH